MRLAAVALFTVCVGVGTLRDRVHTRSPIQVDGYEILSGDFHVHAFLGDGGLAPWVLQYQAARAGLDVITITNHNQTLAGRIGRWASRRSSGPMLIAGEEITGTDFHLIAVGIERAVDWKQPARDAIDQVHAQGGVAIAAHPLRGFSEGYDERALRELDGLEAAHPDALQAVTRLQFEEFYNRTTALNTNVAAIGSSDFHMEGPLGLCRTYLFVRERSQAGVVDAIRDGRTVGRCGSERLRGRPELVQLLEPHADALAAPEVDLLSRAASFGVWLALVAFAILGPREHTKVKGQKAKGKGEVKGVRA